MKVPFAATVSVFEGVPMMMHVLADRSVLRTVAVRAVVKMVSARMVNDASKILACEVAAMTRIVSLVSAVLRMSVASPALRTPVVGTDAFVRRVCAKMDVAMTRVAAITRAAKTTNASPDAATTTHAIAVRRALKIVVRRDALLTGRDVQPVMSVIGKLEPVFSV